jgi:hypothetical protein
MKDSREIPKRKKSFSACLTAPVVMYRKSASFC